MRKCLQQAPEARDGDDSGWRQKGSTRQSEPDRLRRTYVFDLMSQRGPHVWLHPDLIPHTIPVSHDRFIITVNQLPICVSFGPHGGYESVIFTDVFFVFAQV